MTDPEDYTDPILEEKWRIQEELSRRFPDAKSLCDYVRELQRLHPWPAGTVSFERPSEEALPSRAEDKARSDR